MMRDRLTPTVELLMSFTLAWPAAVEYNLQSDSRAGYGLEAAEAGPGSARSACTFSATWARMMLPNAAFLARLALHWPS
ncbi:hypothetical protein NUW54_g2256 [Trametes sanguinea]|uniref:Uncharacterized protein n=1 Tax=Trametes sanguinea TaxID=158606 RepID=A0ACC1Q768_9APHY|nr:hypothetical protein NUW54_g2256 [Trametes sanguinea]